MWNPACTVAFCWQGQLACRASNRDSGSRKNRLGSTLVKMAMHRISGLDQRPGRLLVKGLDQRPSMGKSLSTPHKPIQSFPQTLRCNGEEEMTAG